MPDKQLTTGQERVLRLVWKAFWTLVAAIGMQLLGTYANKDLGLYGAFVIGWLWALFMGATDE